MTVHVITHHAMLVSRIDHSVAAMFRILRFSMKSSSRRMIGGAYQYHRAANTLNHLNKTIANRKISCMSSYLSSCSLVFQYPTNQYRMMSGTSSTSKSKCPSTGKYMNVMYIIIFMQNSCLLAMCIKILKQSSLTIYSCAYHMRNS